jgi:hypothetical protein
MSIASPRPSFNLSRRGSTSTINSTRSPSTSRPASIRNNSSTPIPTSSRRRDRTALRDFYNLQSTAEKPPPPALPSQTEDASPSDPLSTLDNASFSAQNYVDDLLHSADTETLLRTLNAITISALGLEGDKKALVYDNYTTLLSATSTISRMRENVDPMAPVTTLEPAVKHIADVAVGIAGSRGVDGGKEEQRETVKWVLGAPERLKGLKEQGKDEEVRKEWEEVRGLLDQWEGVKGVDEVRRKCVEVVGED